MFGCKLQYYFNIWISMKFYSQFKVIFSWKTNETITINIVQIIYTVENISKKWSKVLNLANRPDPSAILRITILLLICVWTCKQIIMLLSSGHADRLFYFIAIANKRNIYVFSMLFLAKKKLKVGEFVLFGEHCKRS